MKSFLHLFIFCMIGLHMTASFAASELLYASSMRQAYGLEKIWQDVKNYHQSNLSNLKIAILEPGLDVKVFNEDREYIADNGYFPPNAQVVEYYDEDFLKNHDLSPETKIGFSNDGHGRRMAQIVWGLTKTDGVAPQIYYLNANGFTNFKRAVQYCIDEQVDIILYAQAWEFSGNLDGTGLVNDWVAKATEADILWINSVGNYGQAIYQGPLKLKGNQVQFTKASQEISPYLHFTAQADDHEIKIVATWTDDLSNDGKNLRNDLDLSIYEWTANGRGDLVGRGELKQITQGEDDARQASYLPRESLSLSNLKRNQEYVIALEQKAGTIQNNDQVRVIVLSEQGNFVAFQDANQSNTIMIPADNKDIIAVGNYAWDASAGTTIDGRFKPDLVLPTLRLPRDAQDLQDNNPAFSRSTERDAYTLAMFSDGFQVGGTSAEAAIYTAVAALLIGQNGNLQYDHQQLLAQTVATIPASFSPALTKISFPQMLEVQNKLRYMWRIYLSNQNWPLVYDLDAAVKQNKNQFAAFYTTIEKIYHGQNNLLDQQVAQIAAEEAANYNIKLSQLPFTPNKLDKFIAYYAQAGGRDLSLAENPATAEDYNNLANKEAVFAQIIQLYLAQQVTVRADRLISQDEVVAKYAAFFAWLGQQYNGDYGQANYEFMQQLYQAYRDKFNAAPNFPFANLGTFIIFLDQLYPQEAAKLHQLGR
ncbi:MAG: hypothetical protein J6Y94_07160 [Bacteriovoracaceae bacterium]|nr:hypothetical protein [Bacteriovoracaceae bacterium]